MAHPRFKLGRKPRSYNPAVPHFSALAARYRALPPPPPMIDYTSNMPANIGMMLNDVYGDCTCAAFYHARQVWTAHTGTMVTEPDADVLKLYELACGYVPGDASTDQGGNEQDVLTYLVRHGAPIGTGTAVDKLLSFVEIDPRNRIDVHRAIFSCGLVYIGFDVPDYIVPENGDPPDVWDVQQGRSEIVGGHAVILPGYNAQLAHSTVISWGRRYQMTDAFFAKYVSEVYALNDAAWMTKTGRSLLAMSHGEHTAQMRALAA